MQIFHQLLFLFSLTLTFLKIKEQNSHNIVLNEDDKIFQLLIKCSESVFNSLLIWLLLMLYIWQIYQYILRQKDHPLRQPSHGYWEQIKSNDSISQYFRLGSIFRYAHNQWWIKKNNLSEAKLDNNKIKKIKTLNIQNIY